MTIPVPAAATLSPRSGPEQKLRYGIKSFFKGSRRRFGFVIYVLFFLVLRVSHAFFLVDIMHNVTNPFV